LKFQRKLDKPEKTQEKKEPVVKDNTLKRVKKKPVKIGK
jgi:hypothetical protein